MNIKKGDKVVVISGADKGKEGIVQRAYPKLNKVVVEGVNVRKKHKKPTRVYHKVVDGKKIRVAKSGEALD